MDYLNDSMQDDIKLTDLIGFFSENVQKGYKQY